MKITSFITAATAAFILAAPTAVAGDFDLSGGGTYLFDGADSGFSFTALTARGAYWFTDTIGFEGEFSTGLSGTDNFDSSGIDFELKNQYGGYLVGRFPAGQSGELFGRVGFNAGTIDGAISGISAEVDYNGFSLGGGYTYFIQDNFGIRGEVTTSGASLDNNLDADGNLTSFSLSVLTRFGG